MNTISEKVFRVPTLLLFQLLLSGHQFRIPDVQAMQDPAPKTPRQGRPHAAQGQGSTKVLDLQED